MSGEQASAVCLSCHKADQMMWAITSHSKLRKGCLTCHDPHNGEGRTMLREEGSELCSRCHPQQVAETHLPSHHPIPEGKMTCADCHNVHGDERNALPAASNSEMCYRCHAEKAGPFLNEHPPVTEDCTTCHEAMAAPSHDAKDWRPQGHFVVGGDQPDLCALCHGADSCRACHAKRGVGQ
jgi:DmsE family decaheme c-type cytochrome